LHAGQVSETSSSHQGPVPGGFLRGFTISPALKALSVPEKNEVLAADERGFTRVCKHIFTARKREEYYPDLILLIRVLLR
jgi:hypothetical protein